MTETELRERLMRLEKLVGLVLHIDARLGRIEAATNRIASRVGVEGVPTYKTGPARQDEAKPDMPGPGMQPEYSHGDAMKPILNPATDLIGATPEKLARALFRPLRPPQGARPVGQAVVSDEHAVGEPAPEQASEGVPHLRQRP